jgi:ribosome biogenesis protein Tsr3
VAPLVWDIEAEYVRRIEEVEKQLPGLMAEEPKNYGVIGMANLYDISSAHYF